MPACAKDMKRRTVNTAMRSGPRRRLRGIDGADLSLNSLSTRGAPYRLAVRDIAIRSPV